MLKPMPRRLLALVCTVAVTAAGAGGAGTDTPSPAPAACAPALSAAAQSLVEPVLRLRNQQLAQAFDAQGRATGQAGVSPELDARLDALLQNRGPAGDEALAYLLTVYLGEGQGEALVCEATNRGPRLLPLIERLRSCPPAPGLVLHPLAQGSGALPGLALQGIASGQACTMEP